MVTTETIERIISFKENYFVHLLKNSAWVTWFTKPFYPTVSRSAQSGRYNTFEEGAAPWKGDVTPESWLLSTLSHVLFPAFSFYNCFCCCLCSVQSIVVKKKPIVFEPLASYFQPFTAMKSSSILITTSFSLTFFFI